MSGVDDDTIHPLLHQSHGPLPSVAEETNGRAHPEPAGVILGGIGVFVGLHEVLESDQALEFAPRVDDGQLLDLVLRQQRQGVVVGDTDGRSDQGHPRHDLAHRTGTVILEAQVAVGDDSEQHPVVVHHGQPGDTVLGTGIVHLLEARPGPNRHGLGDHPGLRALHLIHHVRLVIDGQVAVQDPDAALTSHGDGHAGLRDGVHGSRGQRNVQPDVAAEPGIGRRLRRDDVRFVGLEQHVIEGQSQGLEGGRNARGGQIRHEIVPPN